jgi:apolipoprotein N-acyltransferase
VADLGVAISYENLFARVAREAARHGAELLVVPTNASSYVTDEVPVQQLAGARLRA